jgi:glutathione S-transferase
MGRDAKEKALVLQWNHRIENEGFMAIAEALRNKAKGFKGRALTGPTSFEQIPALVERGIKRTEIFFRDLEEHLGESPYMVGDRFTLADITGLVVVDFANWIKFPIPEDHVNTKRWHQEISQRPSAGL